MEAIVGIVVGVVVFMHAWQIFGTSQPRTTGLVGAAGAILLAALLAFRPLPSLTKASATAIASSIAVFTLYAALVAAANLWGMDARGLGLYSAYAGVWMIGQILYSVLPIFSIVGLVCGIAQFIAFVMLFCYLGLRLEVLRKATAWVLVIVGPIHGILAALMLLAKLT